MTQSEQLNNVLRSLDSLTNEFIRNLSKNELKELRASISCKEMIISRAYKERIHCKTHFKPESKG